MRKGLNRTITVMACIGLFFSPKALMAQIDFRSGFISKKKGDTLRGFVAYRSDKLNLENCLFKQQKKGKAQRYTSSEIDSYGLTGGKTYESIVLPKGYPSPGEGKVFVKVLVQGALTLYQHDQYFLLKNQDSLFTLPKPRAQEYESDGLKVKIDNKYVGILTYLMLDCKINLNQASYSESGLTKVVYHYNTCKDLASAKKNTQPVGRLNFQLFTGYLSSKVGYDYGGKYIPFSSTTIMGGAGFELSTPRSFDKIFFTVEGWMVKAFYQGYYEGVYAGDPIKQDLYMDISYFKVPFGFKYNFLRAENTPYVRLGLFWCYTVTSSVNTYQERKVGTSIYTDQIPGGYQIKNPKGYWLAIGYDKQLYRGLRMFTELRYEKGEGFFGSPVVSQSSMTNLSFLLGIRF